MFICLVTQHVSSMTECPAAARYKACKWPECVQGSPKSCLALRGQLQDKCKIINDEDTKITSNMYR